jgi:hypothetical protein
MLERGAGWSCGVLGVVVELVTPVVARSGHPSAHGPCAPASAKVAAVHPALRVGHDVGLAAARGALVEPGAGGVPAGGAALDVFRPRAAGTASASFGTDSGGDAPTPGAAVSPSTRGGATRVGSSEGLVVTPLSASKVVGQSAGAGSMQPSAAVRRPPGPVRRRRSAEEARRTLA